MVQIVNVLLEDDLDGSEATETVGFGLGADVYEIDLNEKHAAELRESLAAFVAAARPVKLSMARTPVRGGHKGTRPAVPARAAADRGDRGAELAKIRAWARLNGQQVKERGRVPAAVEQAYYAAQAGNGSKATASPQGAAVSVPAVPVATFTPVQPASPEKPARGGRKPRTLKDPS